MYGISPRDFWKLTLSEFSLIQSGFKERFEIEQREDWERIRWQTFVLLQPSVKKGSLKSPEDLIRFTWEEKPPNVLDLINMGAFDEFPNELKNE